MKRLHLVLLAVLALVLTACGGDDDAEGATAPPQVEEEATQVVDSATDEDADQGLFEVDLVPFDPSAEIMFKDVSYTPFTSDEPEYPLANMMLPDDMPWPESAVFVQAATNTTEEAEPVRRNNGAFQVLDPEADIDLVMDFFGERLPALGWELDSEESSETVRRMVWLTHLPHENPERTNAVEMRIEYLAPDEEISRQFGALRWWATVTDEYDYSGD